VNAFPHGAEPSLLLGLIGSPIKHSASPAMHEAMGAAVGRRCHYQLIDVAGADQAKLKAMLEGVRWLGFAGVNVTYPYKELAVTLLDSLAPGVTEIGAVNTVIVRNNKLVGHNTDATGFGRAYRQVIGTPLRQTVALIGAGGVGRAIAFALANLNLSTLRIFDRDAAKTAALAEDLKSRATVIACADIETAVAGADGLVNATPVGMLPNRDCPVPTGLLGAGMWVADAVYSPLWTPLLLAARACGARIMTGRELAICQAVDAFHFFSGASPSAEAAAIAFDAVMLQREGAVHAP
jgi:shikimate dehydrogenase